WSSTPVMIHDVFRDEGAPLRRTLPLKSRRPCGGATHALSASGDAELKGVVPRLIRKLIINHRGVAWGRVSWNGDLNLKAHVLARWCERTKVELIATRQLDRHRDVRQGDERLMAAGVIAGARVPVAIYRQRLPGRDSYSRSLCALAWVV